METSGQSNEGGIRGGAGVELARMLTIVRRALLNWKPSAVLIVLAIGVGLAFALLRKPNYRSETIVIYRQGVRLNDQAGGQSLTLGARLEEMLLARGKLETMLEKLQLYQDVKVKRGMNDAVEEFRKDVTFKARSTDTFSISFKNTDPEVAQNVTALLAQSLIDENQHLRVEQSRVQREFLEAEKDRGDAELKEKERQQAQFLADHPEFALDSNSSSSGVAVRARERENDKAGATDASLDALRRQSLRLDAAIAGDAPALRIEARADPELEAAKATADSAVASAKSDLAAKRGMFTDDHPDVKAAQRRVAEAEAAARTAADRVNASRLADPGAASLDPEVAKQKLKEKKRKIDAEIAVREKALGDKGKQETAAITPNAEASSIVGLETEWARLSRDVSEARTQMNELERNYFRAQIEASSSIGGYSDQVVVLDPAYLPTRPEPPGKSLIVLIAAGAALILGTILAILRALLDDRIYDESDLERISPVLAVVPRGGARRWRK